MAIMLAAQAPVAVKPSDGIHVFPGTLRPEIDLHPDVPRQIIAVSSTGVSAKQRAALVAASGGNPIDELSLVGCYATKVPANRFAGLAKVQGISAMWCIPDATFATVYVAILKAIEYNVNSVPGVTPVNMSLGPPGKWLPVPFDPTEPMNLATQRAAQKGKVIVIAAGNDGPVPDTLNPWAAAPWVIGVGAATADGKHLAQFSSRGRPLDPAYRPTVVANGVDVIVPHPPSLTKTNTQKADEERVKAFAETVPEAKRAAYTIDTGTSIAAPQVTSIAAQLTLFLEELLKRGTESFEIAYESSQAAREYAKLLGPRAVGTIVRDEGPVKQVRYPGECNPTIIKQMIVDMAVPVPGCSPFECGAGFVSFENAVKYFGAFGVVKTELQVLKVL